MSMNQSSITNHIYPKAPTDIFERIHICNKDKERILCKNVKEFEDDQKYIFAYSLSNTVQIEPFISMLRAFETDGICFAKCLFYGYDDDGHSSFCACKSIDEVYRTYDSFPNPWVDFIAHFCDRENKMYRFSLTTSINSKTLLYSVEAKYFNNHFGK